MQLVISAAASSSLIPNCQKAVWNRNLNVIGVILPFLFELFGLYPLTVSPFAGSKMTFKYHSPIRFPFHKNL